MFDKPNYQKKLISVDDQIALLSNRGMIIKNKEIAKGFLKNVSYFRLQGYWWEFQSNKENHIFRQDITFEQVIDLYTFDRKLRIILLDALERIEIALRSKMIYYISIEKGQWWFEDKNLFFNKDFFEESLNDIDRELSRSKEVFIESHYKNYGDQNRPPSYKTLEVISFGNLSKLYSNLNNNIKAKNRIAQEFNLPNYDYLKSWLQSFIIVRNIVAHHSRLWNRNIHFSPRILSKPASVFIDIPENLNSLYYSLSCILFVVNRISKGHTIKEKVTDLLAEYPSIDITQMGFPADWKLQPIWR